MADVLLGLGGNLGDVQSNFDRAISSLCDGITVKLLARSSTYRTPAWGVTDQPDFLNLCIRIETDLTPRLLLERALEIERSLGRDRANERRWGPRAIDIDIIAYGGLALAEAGLTLPHPRWFERAFVVVPLADIASERMIGGLKVREALQRLDTTSVRRI